LNKKSLKLLILSFFLGILSGSLITAYYILFFNLPEVEEIENYRPPEPIKIYSSDGILIDYIGEEMREYVKLSEMADCVTKAVVAAEDAGFFSHTGISLKGITRALFKNIISRRIVQGGSTITQQLAKNLFLTSRKTLSRKIKEILFAIKIEKKLSKSEILELYLNQIYFGNGVYGIKSASRLYFGKEPRELNLTECAFLASLPRSPSLYNPFNNKEKTLSRMRYVLERMHELHFINENELESAKKADVLLRLKSNVKRLSPYFTDYAVSLLEGKIGSEVFYSEVKEVKTTLNYSFQKIAEDALKRGIEELKKRHKRLYSNYSDEPDGCVIILSVKNGEILSMVGGKDYAKSQFNRCVQSRRTIGSLIKPFIYTSAIKSGFSPEDTIWDTPLEYTWKGKRWAPQNYDKRFRGLVTLREALEFSLNIPTIRVLSKIGVQKVLQELSKFGISINTPPDLTLALGTISVSPLDITASFTPFFNKGILPQPSAIKEVIKRDGNKILLPPKAKKILSEKEANTMMEMLMGVVKNGTGKFAQEYADRVGGKTGTTEDYRDAWFIGCSSEVCIGVWIGIDSYLPLGEGETGARACGPLFLEIAKNLPQELFPLTDVYEKEGNVAF
jgi:penicillin-binding protein 1A